MTSASTHPDDALEVFKNLANLPGPVGYVRGIWGLVCIDMSDCFSYCFLSLNVSHPESIRCQRASEKNKMNHNFAVDSECIRHLEQSKGE